MLQPLRINQIYEQIFVRFYSLKFSIERTQRSVSEGLALASNKVETADIKVNFEHWNRLLIRISAQLSSAINLTSSLMSDSSRRRKGTRLKGFFGGGRNSELWHRALETGIGNANPYDRSNIHLEEILAELSAVHSETLKSQVRTALVLVTISSQAEQQLPARSTASVESGLHSRRTSQISSYSDNEDLRPGTPVPPAIEDDLQERVSTTLVRRPLF